MAKKSTTSRKKTTRKKKTASDRPELEGSKQDGAWKLSTDEARAMVDNKLRGGRVRRAKAGEFVPSRNVDPNMDVIDVPEMRLEDVAESIVNRAYEINRDLQLEVRSATGEVNRIRGDLSELFNFFEACKPLEQVTRTHGRELAQAIKDIKALRKSIESKTVAQKLVDELKESVEQRQSLHKKEFEDYKSECDLAMSVLADRMKRLESRSVWSILWRAITHGIIPAWMRNLIRRPRSSKKPSPLLRSA